MLKKFLNTLFDNLNNLIFEKKTLCSLAIFFVLGLIAGNFFTPNFLLYIDWILSKKLLNCICFLLFQFAASTILPIIFTRLKGGTLPISFLVFLRGFCFILTAKTLFCNYSILASLSILIVFLAIEIVIFFNICQILIYYYKHNI